ncbi:unnamed protein product [Danaus chrysippus]|uniref:RNA exonuclease 4 n=1 Tax=Danaus chrysippus TaxID=151541 RepID=A0A8J2R1G6_9NEOP|nr:unnamed protein product [Danaus chrysippus]
MNLVIALDCEMVGSGNRSILAKVSVVDEDGRALLNCFVKPTDTVTDYRSSVHRITARDLEDGESFDNVQRKVAELLKGRILVGHSLDFDLGVLNLPHPEHNKRDFAKTRMFMQNGLPRSLKDLAREHLNKNIQEGHHDSLEDARTCMELYKKFDKYW